MERLMPWIDWFVPPALRHEKSELSLARNFVFTHLFGPAMSQSIIAFLHGSDPNGGWPVWTITLCVWGFWALPFLLRATGNLVLCAALSVELLAFVSLFGAFYYGGVTSPFLPWLIVSLLLGFFYLKRYAWLVIGGFATNIAVFLGAYTTLGFAERVPSDNLQVVGFISILSATVYMAWMAVYYTTMLSNRSALEREMLEREATTARLRDAKVQAEKANQARSIFLAKMSHELRTPLNAVIGYSEMILEAAELNGASEQKKKDLTSINAAGKHLLALVNDVLDISRIEKNEIQVVPGSFDLHDFLTEIVDSTQHIMRDKGNTLLVESSRRLGTVNTDATKLRQAVFNLLSNAAKFTEHGTVTLTARRERSSAGDWIEIMVRDTGIGIAEADVGKLFSNFIQASASTASRFGGTGLGLAHSQKLCGLMGGRISVTSEPGKGSVFTIRIPADFETVRERTTASPAPVPVAA